MKTLKFRAVLVLGVLLGISTTLAHARQEVARDYHEEFNAGADTKLVLSNKYGSIDVKDWDQQKIVVDVVVSVKHSNEEKAQKLLENIDIKFSSDGNVVKVETVINDKFSRINWNDDNTFEINYSVQMPRDANLDLHNKYGNVFISELAGHTQIEVKYGKLTVNKLSRGNEKPLNTLTLAYSSGSSISECGWIKSNMKYSKLTIDKAKAIVAYSSYSKLNVGNASSIVVEGKYDGYEFGTLTNLVMNTSYSGIKMEVLEKKLSVVARYTDFRIENMPATFESIDIESRYGNIRVGLDPQASYKLDGEAGYSKIYFHDTGRVSKIQESNSMTVNGTVGTDPDPSATVKVVTKYGNVKLDY